MPGLFKNLVLAVAIFSFVLAASASEPVRVIFDTDMALDCDDVGAAAVLHALADAGEAEIVAMGVSSKDAYSAACLDAINTFHGRPDIPIGAVKGKAVEEKSKYTKAIADTFPHDLPSTADAPDVVEVYRKTLAAEPDAGVVIVTVGYLTNLKNLLESKPDRYSPLNGMDLVKKKVKRWVCMGLKIPKGREFNIFRDTSASIRAIADWPTPIVFSGWEIGKKVMTGAPLRDSHKGTPIRLAYKLYIKLKDRPSWDQTAVLFAVRGPGDLWDVHSGGRPEVLPDGSNRWHYGPDQGRAYLVEKKAPSEVAAVIEALMFQRPKSRQQ